MAAHFEYNEVGSADLAERDADNPAVRLLDGFGNLAGFTAAAGSHI
ncbi:MAG: hypothetical protein ACR2JB_13635 [Bryobacteraceae bacterium]